jgi:hypothetical protein
MKSQDRRVTLNRPKVVREVSKALGKMWRSSWPISWAA